MATKSVFDTLNSINVSEKVERKNGLSYLSWAWAWGELCKVYPKASYKVYENKDELNYFTDGKTAWVKVGVTVEDREHVEMLPVMDFKNKSIVLTALTSFDVNKAIQRALTKAIARHGLGLYIYAGEDLPESDNDSKLTPPAKTDKAAMNKAKSDFMQQASQITGIDFIKDEKARGFMLESLGVPRDAKTDADMKAQYAIIRKWLFDAELFEQQLDIFVKQYEQFMETK